MIGRFLLLAITLTWLCWAPAVLMPSGIETGSGRVLVYAGGLGPLAAVAIVLLPREHRPVRRHYLHRIIDAHVLRSPAMLASLLLPPTFGLLEHESERRSLAVVARR